MMTPTSCQAEDGDKGNEDTGAVTGYAPEAGCSSSMSCDHFVKYVETSMLSAAVAANTWPSPVQPMRSSRCGQSVGTA
jgi:hypothetical protein